MEKTFMYAGFEIIESDYNGFSVSLVSPLTGKLYLIDSKETSDDFAKNCRECEGLIYSGTLRITEALYRAIADGLGIPLLDVKLVSWASGYCTDRRYTWGFGSYENLVEKLDNYNIIKLPANPLASVDERLGWETADAGAFGKIPAALAPYIDYERIGQDRAINEHGYYITTNDDTTYYVVC